MKKLNELQSYLTRLRGLMLTLIILCSIGSGNVWATDYQLIKSTDDLEVGAHYVLGASYNSTYYFIKTETNTNNRKIVSATVTNGKVSDVTGMMTFTLGGDATNGWTFKTDNYTGTAGYLNATNTTSNNYLKVVATLDNYAKFSISITAAGVATITCKGKTSRHIMYLNGTTCVACYNSQTGAQYVKLGLYKEVASCSVVPTVGSTLSSVSSTVNSITATVPISAIGGCNITENGLVYSTTNSTPTVGGTGCTKVTVTACGSTAANKTVTISDLSCGTSYYVRGYATNAAGTSYTNVTTQSTSACPVYTVTLKDDNSTHTQASYGASVTLPTRTGCTGYTFAGWTKTWVAPQSSWTTTAPTIIPAGSYTPEGNENLYPVYTKTESGGTTDYSKTETFENQGAGTTYNSTQTYTAANSNASLAWSMYYGTVSTNAVLTGSKSAQMRWYSSATSNIPNIKTTTAVSGLQTLTFNAAVGNTNIKMKVEKSTDGSSWTVVASNVSMSTTKTEYSYDISGTIGTGYYIRIGVDGTNSTAPSSGNYTFRVDDVKFDYQEGGGSTTSYISVPACCTDWSTPTVSYSSSLAINASEGVTIGSGTTHGAVTYESSDEDVLTVDADGTIHAVGAGTAHIIATWAGDATYCEKSANSNDVTVSGIQVTGTTPVNFGQVYQNAVVANKTISVTGLGLASDITPSLPVGSPFSFSPASLAANSSNATLTISASTATLGTYNQTLTLTSGAFSATVTVKMEVIAKPTATFTDALHNLTEDEDGVSLSSYNLTAAQGTPVVFPTLANQTKSAGTCEGEYYIFVGWTEGDNNTDPEDHLVTSYTLANGDTKNYYAVWADASGSATYTKLTSNSFSGSPAKYVLGAEHEGTTYYFSDYDPDNIAYNLSWGTCSSSDAPIQFTLSGTASALVAKDNLNNYLEAPCTTKAFYISGSETSVELKSNGTIYNNGDGCTSYRLRYNYNSGSGGLRWYTSDTGDPAYFYLVGAAGTVHYRTSCCANKVDAPVVTATTVTSTSITLTWPSDDKATGWQIEWNGAGGWVTPSGSCTHTVSGLTPNTTYTWRVRATYEDPVCGADVRSGSTTTNQVYHVTYAKGSGTGTCTATGSTTDETGYEAGATVTLQANEFSLSGHTFAGWTEDDDDITISSNQFTMPDHDVVITASWTAKMDKYFDRMHDQTDALHGGVEETEGTNEGKYYIPKEGCNYSIPTAVDSNTGDACQTSHYKLQGWIAASYMKGYPNNMTGEIGTGNEVHIFPPTGTKTATGATYYAIWAEVTE